MYLVGSEHPHKIDAQRLLETLVAGGERLITDAEVLQEILHRYAAIKRHNAIQPAFDALLGIVDDVFPVEQEDVEKAKSILAGSDRISARDALHIAIMKRRGIETILSFDAAFDACPGITRVRI
jgi:predicted nucleic acid-binding protein